MSTPTILEDLDMRSLVGELRGIYAALPDNADVSGRALADLLRRLDETPNHGEQTP